MRPLSTGFLKPVCWFPFWWSAFFYCFDTSNTN